MSYACTTGLDAKLKCFDVRDTPKTNAQAQQACRDGGMELAYFMDEVEYKTFKAARDALGILDDGVWINGYRKDGSSAYDKNGFEYHILQDYGSEKIIDFGTPGVYKNWHSGEPNSGHHECLHVKSGDSYEWADTACYKTMPYSCKLTISDVMKKACTSDDSKCFYVYADEKTNAQAQESCRDYGLDLAYFMNADEYNVFKKAKDELSIRYGGYEGMWINGYRKDSFYPTNKIGFEYHILQDGNERSIGFGTPGVYRNWNSGEPNSIHAGCVAVMEENKWNDAYCGSSFPYACCSREGESAQEKRVCKN